MAYLTEDTKVYSSRLAKTIATRYPKTKQAYLNNIKLCRKILSEKGYDIVAIQSYAIRVAKDLRPMIININNPKIKNIKNLKMLLIRINIHANKFIAKLGIKEDDKTCKLLSLMLLSSTVFQYCIKYDAKIGYLPINLASIYFGPIIEEVGGILNKRDDLNLSISNTFKPVRPVTKWLTSSIYYGVFKVPFSITSISLVTIDKSNKELLKDERIQKFIKIKIEEGKTDKTIDQLFYCLLYGIFIDDVLPYTIKIIRLVDSLTNA